MMPRCELCGKRIWIGWGADYVQRIKHRTYMAQTPDGDHYSAADWYYLFAHSKCVKEKGSVIFDDIKREAS